MDQTLWQRIEELRTKLYEYAVSKSLADSDVVALSQRLDGLLNQYYQL